MSASVRSNVVAYLAGIVDGEGSIYLASRKDSINFYPCLKVTMNDKRVMEWISLNFGGALRVHRRPIHTNAESGYTWQTRSKQQLRELLTELLPFLITKRLQAETVLEYIRMSRRQRGGGQNYTDDERQRLTAFRDFMRVLNSKGRGSNDRKAALYAIADAKSGTEK